MMSGDCNYEEPRHSDGKTNSDPRADVGNSTTPSKSRSRASGSARSQKNSNCPGYKDGEPEREGVDEFPKNGLRHSKHELMDSAEFNKTIATWFGEKGFLAMRSFFRASVLNSLQKDPAALNQVTCSDLDVMIVTLIADYLVKNGKNFTMSVFSNEVLRPLAKSNLTLKLVLQRIGQCEDLGEPTLTRDMVSFILRTLDVQTHSTLGAGILRKYLEDRAGDVLSILMGLLRDNAASLNVKDRAVRDDDVVAAFSEGLKDEMRQLHSWFLNFNNQFVDVSGRVRQLICTQTIEDRVRFKKHQCGQDDYDLWDQMVRMDEHLKKQQECLMKLRDKERRKLATYAKELEDLHQEMNLKLKSIQDYEKTLKIREKALRECEAQGVPSVVHCDRADCMADVAPKRDCPAGVDNRDMVNQCADTRMGSNETKGMRDTTSGQLLEESVELNAKRVSSTFTGQIMEENLELRAILREQNLRIEALTKKAALLSCTIRPNNEPMTSQLPNLAYACTSNQGYDNIPAPAKRREVLPPQPLCRKPINKADSLVSAMSSCLRRARMEIDYLRDEQSTTDLQYDRLLHNKLSKRL